MRQYSFLCTQRWISCRRNLFWNRGEWKFQSRLLPVQVNSSLPINIRTADVLHLILLWSLWMQHLLFHSVFWEMCAQTLLLWLSPEVLLPVEHIFRFRSQQWNIESFCCRVQVHIRLLILIQMPMDVPMQHLLPLIFWHHLLLHWEHSHLYVPTPRSFLWLEDHLPVERIPEPESTTEISSLCWPVLGTILCDILIHSVTVVQQQLYLPFL